MGFAAGLGEFLGYGLRLFTGWLGDRTRAYWPLVVAGYAVNLVAVPGLALVGSWQAAVALLLLERIGKAVRSPARSTLVSYAANEAGVGKSFGLEEALDQIGPGLRLQGGDRAARAEGGARARVRHLLRALRIRMVVRQHDDGLALRALAVRAGRVLGRHAARSRTHLPRARSAADFARGIDLTEDRTTHRE